MLSISPKALTGVEPKNKRVMKKSNKIFVVVASDYDTRCKMLARLAVQHGFAKVPSDGMKLVSPTLPEDGFAMAYFIICGSYNFRGATITNQHLFEMAARGLFVAVGVKALPREYQFICEAYYPEDFPL